jgi:hypothetical protein
MVNCNNNTCFKSVNNISDDFLLNILESNFKTFFDWSFLQIGAWFDANINDYTFFNSNVEHSTLLPVADESYTDGQVWQGIRKDWVWENDVVFNGTTPTSISGIYVNDSYIPKNDSYFVDYPNGRIIFEEPQDITSVVRLNYSYKNIQTYRASDSPWFNVIQYNTFETNNPDISRTDDGSWNISGNHRIQLPAIVIESVARSRSKGYELGNDNLLLEQDIAFYVLAENKNDRNKLLDILRLQQDLHISLYNTNDLAKDDKYPLDYRGDKKANSLMYPDIVNDYAWRVCWIKDVSLFEIDSINPNFHQGLARATVEIISD